MKNDECFCLCTKVISQKGYVLTKDSTFINAFQQGFEACFSAFKDEIKELKEKNKKLEFMVENGLGYEDLKNDF